MAKALVSEVGRVAFELDRFELVGGEACEVHGRWFGVRGRRFMRPALTLVVGGRPVRLLADLAHKPWAAEDGEPWQAVFPCDLDGAEVEEAELTVGSDVTIALPPPQGGRGAGKRRPAGQRSATSRPARRLEPGRSRSHRATAKAPADLAEELGKERSARQRLERQLQRTEADLVLANSRVRELGGEIQQLAGERDTALAASDQIHAAAEALQRERDRIAGERDAALAARRAAETEIGQARRERDEALQAARAAAEARERALAERAQALAARTAALAGRDAALAASEQAVAEQEGALALRDHAVAERDAAVAARDDVIAQRDALARTNERLQGELSDVLSARGAALVMRRAAQESATRPYAVLIPRVIGGVLVLIIVVFSLLLLHVL